MHDTDQFSLADLLRIEDDPAVLNYRCPETEIPLWSQIRIQFFRMIMLDFLYGHQDGNKKIPIFRAIKTMAHSVLNNAILGTDQRCSAKICIFGEGVANRLVGRVWVNRLTDGFVGAYPEDTLVIENHFEWQWPSPRRQNRLFSHTPIRVLNAIDGRLRVRAHHKNSARSLVDCLVERSKAVLDWSPSQDRYDNLTKALAHRAAYLPAQHSRYMALLRKVNPCLLMVGAGCYGGDFASLIVAARRMRITTAEYQHGAISAGHDAYNFSATVCNSASYRETLPEYFLGYGPWWLQQINAPVKKIAIGNPGRPDLQFCGTLTGESRARLLILSDGMEFSIYLELASKIRAVVKKMGLDVAIRPHPIERSKVDSMSPDEKFGIPIDSNPDIYRSFATSFGVISEVSTGLFEAIGVVKHIYVWKTKKTEFCYPRHPFEEFSSISELVAIVETSLERDGNNIDPKEFWEDAWKVNYKSFVEKCC